MAAKHTDHYAILVGIARYPRLGEGNMAMDLRGPRNDVQAIKDWLLDPNGGNFASEATIFEVDDAQVAAGGDGIPTAAQLDQLMVKLHELALKNPRRQVGRRIYIYMSGHGFSPGRQRACLFTADAQEHNAQNVHATGWLNWLQDSGYFREFVLWVDACMNRAVFISPHDPPLPPSASATPPLASFCAFAAQRPLKAVEMPIAEDGRKVHGVFTWALLEGLRGAAADVNGRVTGRSLADWVRNAMSSRYGPAELENRDIAQEPEVILEDAGLIFARGVAPPVHAVTLAFPPTAAGAAARLWAGTPPQVLREFTVPADGKVDVQLKPGLYLAEAGPIRHGFEVLRACGVAVSELGPDVIKRGGSDVFQLQLRAKDATAEIFVVDSRFCLVDRGVGQLDTPLPAGIFKVKVRTGNAINQQVMLVDRDEAPQAATERELATVLPLADTAAKHETHEAGWQEAMQAAHDLPCGPGESVLLCMTRTFSRRPDPVPNTTAPWRGLRIVDANGQVVIDMEHDAQRRQAQADPLAFAVRTLPAGQYFLRQRIGGEGEFEQSLLLCAGWRTEAYVLRRVVGQGTDIDPRPRLAVMMRRPGTAPDAAQQHDRDTEVAKQALAGERRILTPELEASLFGCGNPIAAIIAGHLLLVEHERDPSRDLTALDELVKGLRRDLGAGFPDVEALALHCPSPALRRIGELRGPPLFHRSWVLLAAAAQRRPELIPAAMWSRMQALSALPPFLVWNTADSAKSAVRADLLKVLYELKAPGVQAAATLGAPAAMPAAMPAITFRAGARRPAADDGTRAARRRAARLGLPPSVIDALQAGAG